MKVGRLKVIFHLPSSIPIMDDAIVTWPKKHLAYVEWFTVSEHPGQNHKLMLLFRTTILFQVT